ncbi:MAG: hypothetical protein HN929_00315 [Chloroflexi bacterium]|nr:hypothetical protein [Chloroflexota bacterium]MBT7079914.1 hypothetical protein [Chloroflexota bacterium]MBT7288866.1 hypothetical protein [Chloroflexota bacterium]
MRIAKNLLLGLLVFALCGLFQPIMITPAYAAAGDPTVVIDDIPEYVKSYIHTLVHISGTASGSDLNDVQVQIQKKQTVLIGMIPVGRRK